MPKKVDIAPSSLAGFPSYYRADFTPLIGFVMNLGAKPEEARDVAQEAMQAAMRRWPEIEYPRAFTRKAAERVYLRDVQKARRVREAVLNDVGRRAATAPDVAVRQTGERFALELLTLLPSEQRAVMAWTIDGYSCAEIAEITGHKPATVRSHLRHARRRLQRELKARKEASDGP
ncbi:MULTISPECIES: RNA polymerase sigma factor [Actinomadura]|uniref:RNA polymerase sigma factor n=2 Tax=Actinomadura yumaensis TaxID=111807 RepID=A0ABW2CMP9_9ACTN|nr:sigma-70 family RNA polymerase sigma factor [Actinomadura sp. J1-007]